MIRLHSRSLRLAAAGLTLALLGAACAGPNPDAAAKGKVDEATTTTIAKGPDTTASQLRSRLTGLLQEHVYLAAGGHRRHRRRAQRRGATRASDALEGNSDALADNFEAIFAGTTEPDPTTAKQFRDLWKRHVGYVVAYAQGSSSRGRRPGPVRQGLRRVHQLAPTEPARRRRHQSGVPARAGAPGRGRRREGQGLLRGLHRSAGGSGPHGHGGRRADGRHRQEALRQDRRRPGQQGGRARHQL